MAPTHSELQVSPEPAQLAALADAARPGAAVVSVTRLEGGVDNGMHVLELELPSGQRERVVLRRYGDELREAPGRRAALEWQLLGFLERAGVAAPRPVLDDAQGVFAGSPAIVTSYIPGKAVPNLDGREDGLAQLARALQRIHALDTSDAGFLGEPENLGQRVLRERQPSWVGTHPAGAGLWGALCRKARDLDAPPRVFIHGDLWLGNTLWDADTLLAVVDWDGAGLGDPARDVANLWMELALSDGLPSADRLVATYRRATGRALSDLRFYALFAVSRPLAYPDAFGIEKFKDNLNRAIQAALDRTERSWREEPTA